MIVYLDTNVYYGAKFVFEKNKFKTLIDYIKTGEVQVIYTSATISEVHKHLEKEISGEICSYNRAIRKNLSKYEIEQELSIKEIGINEVISSRKRKLQEFLDLDGVNCISLNPIDAEQLMADYFDMKAPFESKKPNEFKDAIMINAIRNYQKEVEEQICVVSSDDGFRKAFEDVSQIVCFKFLGEFFKYLQKQTELDKYYEILKTKGFFKDEIRAYVEERPVDRADYCMWCCTEVKMIGIHLELMYIEKNEDEDILLLHILTDYALSAKILHRDEELSYYDKEEGMYLFEELELWQEEHRCEEEIIVKCSFDENKQGFHLIEIESEKNADYIELDDESMIDFTQISTTYDSMVEIETCSQCGKIIKSSYVYSNHKGEPLCQNCMVDDKYGMVCPTCGRKVPHELSAGGFCQECFDKQ